MSLICGAYTLIGDPVLEQLRYALLTEWHMGATAYQVAECLHAVRDYLDRCPAIIFMQGSGRGAPILPRQRAEQC
jgi:hypothetical protein